MPEQLAHHQETIDSDQQIYYYKNQKENIHENYRLYCSGMVQRQN